MSNKIIVESLKSWGNTNEGIGKTLKYLFDNTFEKLVSDVNKFENEVYKKESKNCKSSFSFDYVNRLESKICKREAELKAKISSVNYIKSVYPKVLNTVGDEKLKKDLEKWIKELVEEYTYLSKILKDEIQVLTLKFKQWQKYKKDM